MLPALFGLLALGCGQQMAEQPSYRPLRPSPFFADDRSARPVVAGTVARGQLDADVQLYTGKKPAEPADWARAAGMIGMAASTPILAPAWTAGWSPYADTFPFPIMSGVLERGQERFNIYCAVCHDRTGSGKGMVVQRGFTPPPSYHTDLSRGLQLQGQKVLLRDAPVGYYFAVITHGFGAMPNYSEQVAVEDRWAIIAYIRALQLSQRASLSDVRDAREKQKLLGGTP